MSDYFCPLNKFGRPPAANEDEMEQMRRNAWKQQGVFSVKLSDPRLTQDEKNDLKDIAERFYGYSQEVV